VSKTLKETVDGSIEVETNDEFVDNADEQQRIHVDHEIRGEAPEVWIEARKRIRITCGTSVVTLTEDTISFKGTNLDLTGAAIDAGTGVITHN